MSQPKNRYGRTAARVHTTLGRARRPSSTTVDVHCHILVPEAATFAGPHVDVSKIPLARYADALTREINLQQDADRTHVMTDIDARLIEMDATGIDIQVVAPLPPQCYFTVDPKIAETAHRMVNEGVAAFVAKRPDRFAGLGAVTLQEPELAVAELETVMELGLKGVQILTNVAGEELSDPRFEPFFAAAERLGAFVMLHPLGFTEGQRLTKLYLNNVIGNPLETTLAVHNLIMNGTLAKFPELKVLAVHGGGFLPSYSGRIDHAWGAREDARAGLPLPPTSYLRQVYLDTVVFSVHQLEYLIEVFGADRILMGTDYPFDMAESDPVGHVAAVEWLEERDFEAICGGNAVRALGL
jgi:aminocarboxymuconate-semialdehyde decarboxylase